MSEVVFDSAQVIEWYAQREEDIENEKLRRELDDLCATGESDLQPGTTEYERYRLTKAQADGQKLKNTRETGEVTAEISVTHTASKPHLSWAHL